jgi:uncharacterized repeat protein (TIGR01451 family)
MQYDLGADEYTGVDLSLSTKRVTPLEATAGEVVTFILRLQNRGQQHAPETLLVDPIPAYTAYVPNSARATSGTLTDTQGVRWTGDISVGEIVTVTFQVTVTDHVTVNNVATVTDTYGTRYELMAQVNPARVYLPLVLRAP